MQEIDTSKLDYITQSTYPDLLKLIYDYNRQVRWVNSGAKQLTPQDIAAIQSILAAADAFAMSISQDTNADQGTREEAGGILAAIKYELDHPPMDFS